MEGLPSIEAANLSLSFNLSRTSLGPFLAAVIFAFFQWHHQNDSSYNLQVRLWSLASQLPHSRDC